ncbi:MAG: CIA30 family protein [Synechococcus sp.]
MHQNAKSVEKTNAGWDVKRLFNTLLFFGAVPILSNCSWFARMTGQSSTIAYGTGISSPTTLAIGDSGSETQQWIDKLVQQGYRVRLLDLGPPVTATEMFSGISRQLPLEQVARGVTSVIVCSHRTEAVEYAQIAIAQAHLDRPHSNRPSETSTVFDFSQPLPNLSDIWGSVDDVVMGGVSSSSIRMGEGIAIFSGTVSTSNSGGFASVRTRNLEPDLNLSGFDGIVLRVRGDGQRYKFLMRDEQRWDGVAYGFSFDTVASEWIDVRIPFTDLIPVMRAKTVPNAGPINTSRINALQLMLSKFEYDGALNPSFQPGEFRLDIESISTYRESSGAGIAVPACQTLLIQWLEENGLAFTTL